MRLLPAESEKCGRTASVWSSLAAALGGLCLQVVGCTTLPSFCSNPQVVSDSDEWDGGAQALSPLKQPTSAGDSN